MTPNRLTKFGQLTEDAEGNLVFTDFAIDPNHQFQSDEIGIICIVKHRLGIEYTKLIKPHLFDNVCGVKFKQSEAQRLAAALDALLGYRGINADVGKAAAKLRHQEAVNAQLPEMVQDATINIRGENFNLTTDQWATFRAAIAAAKEQS